MTTRAARASAVPSSAAAGPSTTTGRSTKASASGVVAAASRLRTDDVAVEAKSTTRRLPSTSTRTLKSTAGTGPTALKSTGTSRTTKVGTRAGLKAKVGDGDGGGEDGTGLARDLDRVLKITQPRTETNRPAPTSSSVNAKQTGGLSSRTAATLRTTKTATTTTGSASRVSSKSTATSARTIPDGRSGPSGSGGSMERSQGKVKSDEAHITLEDLEMTLPWSNTDDGMKPSERTRGAMTAVNSSLKSLTTAIQAGFKLDPSSATPHSVSKGKATPSIRSNDRPQPLEGKRGGWTVEEVEREVMTLEIGLRVLRELNGKEGGGPERMNRSAEVERAAQSVVSKLLGMGMFDRAIQHLLICKTRIERELALPEDLTKDDDAEKRLSLLELDTSAIRIPENWRPIVFQCLAHAQTALIATKTLEATKISDFIPLPRSSTSSGHDTMHALQLALLLPVASTSFTLSLLHRQLLACPMDDLASFFHIRFLALYLVSLMTSVEPNSAFKSDRLFDHVYKTVASVTSRAKADIDTLRLLTRETAHLISWIGRVAETRGNTLREWTNGDARWTETLDVWMNLARKINDSSMIEHVLSYMTASISITDDQEAEPETRPRPSSSSSSSGSSSTTSTSDTKITASPLRRPSASAKSRGKQKFGNVESRLSNHVGALSMAEVSLNKYIETKDSMHSASSESAIRSTEFESLLEDLQVLPSTDAGKSVASKATRALHRVRRRCTDVLTTSTEDEQETTLHLAIRQWLIKFVDLTEDLLRGPLAEPSIAVSLTPEAIDTTVVLCTKSPLSQSPSLALLQRGHRLNVLAASTALSSADRSRFLRCLATAAHGVAVKYWQKEKAKETLAFVTVSCEWARESLEMYKDGDGNEDQGMVELMGYLCKRYEFLGACQAKLTDLKAAFNSYVDALAFQPPNVISQIRSSSRDQAIKQVFATLAHPTQVLGRLTQLLIYDPVLMRATAIGSLERLVAAKIPVEAVGAIGEMMFAIVEEKSKMGWREGMAEAMFEFGETVFKMYDENQYPLRRLRMASQLMTLVLQIGRHTDRSVAFADLSERVSRMKDYAEDSGLLPYLPGLLATSSTLRALNAYQASTESTTSVLSLAQQAIVELRELIVPPTAPRAAAIEDAKRPLGRAKTVKRTTQVAAKPVRSTTKSTAVRTASDTKAVKETKSMEVLPPARASSSVNSQPIITPQPLDNASALASLVGSLASLLGLLGLSLQKVDCLKTLRGILRHRKDLTDQYIHQSAELGSEYLTLGKMTRANTVFTQAIRYTEDHGDSVSLHVRCDLRLRYAMYLATMGHVDEATEAYRIAGELAKEFEPADNVRGYGWAAAYAKIDLLERAALARYATAAIASAEGDASNAIIHLGAAYRLFSRIGDRACQVANNLAAPSTGATTKQAETKVKEDDDDPFTAPSSRKVGGGASKDKGQDEPAKDEAVKAKAYSQTTAYENKVLTGFQWRAGENLLKASLDYATLLGQRGSLREAEFILQIAGEVAEAVHSTLFVSRIATREADLLFRSRRYDDANEKLDKAIASCPSDVDDCPLSVEIKRVRGDLLARQEFVSEAKEVFVNASSQVQSLDALFSATEALLPSPRKGRISTVASPGKKATPPRMGKGKLSSSFTPTKGALSRSVRGAKETILPVALAQILGRQAWLLVERDSLSLDSNTSQTLLSQLQELSIIRSIKADKLHLDGRLALQEAFDHFKTDLWMSSLTESTIAMPMGISKGRQQRDRQSTRDSIQMILERSQRSFEEALGMSISGGGEGRVEDIRRACLSLALLRAFQTSLGQGSESITAAAAEMLAASPAITLHRELLEAIDSKLKVYGKDEEWPKLSSSEVLPSPPTNMDKSSNRGHKTSKADGSPPSQQHGETRLLAPPSPQTSSNEDAYRSYWSSMRDRYTSQGFLNLDQSDLDKLPSEWVVVSINVTEDKNTMFISRHQSGHEPLVLSLPLDRQGRRDGEAEEDLFTFDTALQQMEGIIQESNQGARDAKNISTAEGRAAWWAKRHELDARLKELVANLEFCWLGAFKTILAPSCTLSADALLTFKQRLESIFNGAISGGTRASGARTRVELDDSLLSCLATLSPKCKDEEAEDLVYFILDIYQFHGVPVALAELDIDQIGIDLRSALSELEGSRPSTSLSRPEHVFLALDKNVSGFPWESIPILRRRSVSRVPSLPFLLHQYELSRFIANPTPSSTALTPNANTTVIETRAPSSSSDLYDSSRPAEARSLVDSRKVFYVLNPSGDLSRTQTHFESWIQTMVTKAGWKGIVGRPPTEMELESALKEYDLVIYFGHGGAEQFIRSHKVRHLTRCATTMLWGCSSGHLKDQGDFDRRGTAWDYMTGGCPSLVATLWDVTDRDIDRLSESVFNKLKLGPAHVSAISGGGGSTKSSKSSSNLDLNLSLANTNLGSVPRQSLLPLSELSIPQAVAKSRDDCKLTYLTGAAPVIYGLPVWLA